MSYLHDDHYEWIDDCKHYKSCSVLGKNVANILGFAGGGIYNCPINHENVNWDDERHIEVSWRGSLASFDNLKLTYLLIMCFKKMVRVEISPCNFHHIKLQFWQRHKRDGGISERLPKLETIIESLKR